jgi:hypothetical protein
MGVRTTNVDLIGQEGGCGSPRSTGSRAAAGRAAFITEQLPVRTGLITVGTPGSPACLQKEDWGSTLTELTICPQVQRRPFGDFDYSARTGHTPIGPERQSFCALDQPMCAGRPVPRRDGLIKSRMVIILAGDMHRKRPNLPNVKKMSRSRLVANLYVQGVPGLKPLTAKPRQRVPRATCKHRARGEAPPTLRPAQDRSGSATPSGKSLTWKSRGSNCGPRSRQ